MRKNTPNITKARWCVEMSGAHGATGDEIEATTGILHQSLGPALIALRKAEKITDSGRTRATRNGYQAIVWVAQ